MYENENYEDYVQVNYQNETDIISVKADVSEYSEMYTADNGSVKCDCEIYDSSSYCM